MVKDNGKAATKAKAKATKVVKEAKAAARKKTDDKYAAERVANCSDETYAQAVEVRRLREAGMPWWAIAHEMELPGHGPNVATGKTGASRARRIYKAAFGALPETSRSTAGDTGGPRRTKNTRLKAALAKTRTEDIFPEDMPDEEVIDRLRNQRIFWAIKMDYGDGTSHESDNEANIGENLRIVMGTKGRTVCFNEVAALHQGRPVGGPSRSVYLHAIWKIGVHEYEKPGRKK